MKIPLLVVISASVAFALPSTFAEAERCAASQCKIENGCACAKSSSPLGNTSSTPQFITLTFDDSLTIEVEESVHQLLSNRRNPDGSFVSATLYVSHRYTDYSKVNDLYNFGYEIGVNSISKGSAEYFANAPEDVLVDEFHGQRIILAKFANISIDDIKGVRTPNLQLNEDKSFNAYNRSGLEYDNSWPTLSSKPLYPYTLDYKSNQQCLVGKCPTQSHPRFWVAPIVNHVGKGGQDCNVLFSCQLNGTAADIRDWFIEQYQLSYNNTRTPINLMVNLALFQLVENSFKGLELFLDYVGTKNDTYLVSNAEVIRWSKNPVPLNKYKPFVQDKYRGCNKQTCELSHGQETVYMVSCVECPDEYPWLGNPEGQWRR